MQPRWRRDGQELFYLTLDQKLTAVAVMPGAAIAFGAPRVVLIENADEKPRITVVLDWPAALKR